MTPIAPILNLWIIALKYFATISKRKPQNLCLWRDARQAPASGFRLSTALAKPFTAHRSTFLSSFWTRTISIHSSTKSTAIPLKRNHRSLPTYKDALNLMRARIKQDDIVLIKGENKHSIDHFTEAFNDSICSNQCYHQPCCHRRKSRNDPQKTPPENAHHGHGQSPSLWHR